MTRLSKYKLKPNVRLELVEKFSKALSRQKTTRELENLLDHLLTPTEIDTFAKRLEIIKKLKSKNPYWSIRDEVKVTNATITKMSNILLKANDVFVRSIDALLKEDETEKENERKSRYRKGSKQVYARRFD